MRLYYPPEQRDVVQRWAAGFDLVASTQRPRNTEGFYLWWEGGRLGLYRDLDPRGICLQPAHFSQRVTLRGELARACGVTAAHKPRVIDAMAGLGVDGMTLAALGCAVAMIERDAAMWALLDSFAQLLCVQDVPAFDCEVVYADAWSWLETAAAERVVDVVYLDPMFPTRRKGALPGKAMQFLADLTRSDCHPLADWIELSRQHASARVVLKRRLRDPVVGMPDWQIKGRSVRYDVYRGRRAYPPRSTA